MIVPGTATTANTPANRSAISQPVPSVSPGTLLLWTYSVSGSGVALPDTPADWSIWQPSLIVGGGSQIGAITWYKFASSSEPASYDLSGLSAGRHSSFMMPYAGVDSTTPQDVANVTNSSTSGHASFSAIRPITPGALVLGVSIDCSANGDVNTTYSTTTPNGVIDVTSSSTSPTTVNAVCAEMHVPWVSGFVTPSLNPSGSPQRGIVYTSALRPAPAVLGSGTFMPYFI